MNRPSAILLSGSSAPTPPGFTRIQAPGNDAPAGLPVPISTLARWQGRSRKAVYTELNTHAVPAGVFWRKHGRLFVDVAKYSAWVKGELPDA